MTVQTKKRGRPRRQVGQAAEDQGWRSNDDQHDEDAGQAEQRPAGNGRRGKARQTYMPGTEPLRIRAIDEAAEVYRDIRDRRKELTTEECKANEKLLGLMKDHMLMSYRYDGSEVTIAKEKEKARVRRIATDDDED